MKCDFCDLQTNSGWCYPARTFIEGVYSGPSRTLVSQSIGDWFACDECHRLIEAGDRSALVNRSVEQFIQEHSELAINRMCVQGYLWRVHDQFFDNRLGDPQPESAN